MRWLRSMHLAADDTIISLGFPKFMNLGEGVGEYKITETDVLNAAERSLYATLKFDGSLLVRYVYNGEVRWRTRGSLSVGMENADEIDEFCKQCPKLSDPNVYPDSSILFEWVSPRNRIVIKYPTPKLVLIGVVDFERGKPWWETRPKLREVVDLERIANEFGVDVVDSYQMRNATEVSRLIGDLKSDTEIEGFVLRLGNGQKLVKVKSDNYRTLHAIRSRVTTQSLVELWVQWGRPDFEQYREKFESSYDFECWEFVLPAVSAMFDGIRDVEQAYQHIEKLVAENRNLPRKDFAIMMQQKYKGYKLSAAFTLLDGKNLDEACWIKLVQQNSKQFEIQMMFKNSVSELDDDC